MNVRSDLGKELKSLLDSDVFRGKIAVRRAYADWRRYPASVVPLTEASVDLIFAPAYGTSKKNATDLRMAVVGNIPIARKRAAADFTVSSPFMDDVYHRLVPDDEGYRTRAVSAAAPAR